MEIVEDQADLDQAFDASDPDSLDRLMQCVKQASLFFSKNVSSAKFVSYIATQVLPVLDQVKVRFKFASLIFNTSWTTLHQSCRFRKLPRSRIFL